MTTTAELEALVREASVILDAAAQRFVAGHGAEGVVFKGGKDFATEEDLAIERMVVQALTERTGIGVHGEEFGGPAVDSGLVWVVDPIDGTVNYAAGSPMAAILLGLMSDGVPVAGLTWLPFMGRSTPPWRAVCCSATELRCRPCRAPILRTWPWAWAPSMLIGRAGFRGGIA